MNEVRPHNISHMYLKFANMSHNKLNKQGCVLLLLNLNEIIVRGRLGYFLKKFHSA